MYLGTLALAQGRPEEARALLDEALGLSLAAHSTRSVTLCLAAFARWALAAGDPEWAALLAGAAEGLRRRAGLQAWPILRQAEAELVAQVRQALGAGRFDQVFAAGARLTQREAVAAARDRHSASTSLTRIPRGIPAAIFGRWRGVVDEDFRRAWAGRAGDYFVAAFGLAPVTARLLAWLMICEPAGQSGSDLAAALGVSRASITTSLRLAQAAGLITRRTRPGDRTVYYVIDDACTRSSAGGSPAWPRCRHRG